MLTDSELMERLVAGDMQALGALFERHKQPLHAFLARLVADHALAEDVLVETFIRVYDKRQSYTATYRFSTWLFTIAHNLAVDRLKHGSRRQRLCVELTPEMPAATDVCGEVARGEVTVAVRAAIQQLPDDMRAVILLREYQGFSYREIADILEVSEEAVRVRAYRARQTLRRTLAPQLQETLSNNTTPEVV